MRNFSRSARLVVVTLCLLASGCTKDKVTQANFDKITTGMTLDQVQAILGKGTKDDSPGASNVAAQFGVDLPGQQGPSRGDTFVWEKGEKKITVVLLDDKVVWKGNSGL